jgi:hypothetical protein
MNAKALKPESLTREELWRKNVIEMKERWGRTAIKTWRMLADLAEIKEETLSRLPNQCPKHDLPSTEVSRLAAVLGVIPESLFTDHIETFDKPTEDAEEASRRFAKLNISSKPASSNMVDVDAIVKLSALSPQDQAMVMDLINRLSQPQTVERQTPPVPSLD